MSSLKFIIANYSDSEDDSSSDGEGKRKKIKPSKDDEIKELNKKDAIEENDNELNKDEESQSSESDSPKIFSIGLAKPTEQQQPENRINQGVDYQDYLGDDFFVVNNNGNDEELDDTIESDPSIIDVDNKELDEANVNNENLNEKLLDSRYSPKSFHRLLIGVDEEHIRIPDAPKDTECSTELIDKINHLHNLMKQGRNLIEELYQRRDLRNPNICDQMIRLCGIDEFGTNLPAEIFDPTKFRKPEPTDEQAEDH